MSETLREQSQETLQVDERNFEGRIHPLMKTNWLAMLGDSVTTDHISPAGSTKRTVRQAVT
nr:patatin family protein [Candidatus Pantoea persica]